ncbi:hypothetical protein K523DRAFT_377338 [Schizophyllum commune Tattone D]|nr:hypothetical protein K523DRAFT_377338 [Schizophyllum commune Tattone D]
MSSVIAAFFDFCILYRSVDCRARRPLCPTVTRGTIRGRRHAYRNKMPADLASDDDPDCIAVALPHPYAPRRPKATGRRARRLRPLRDPQIAAGTRGDSRAINAKIIAIHLASRFSGSLRYLSVDFIPRDLPRPRAAGGMRGAPRMINAEMPVPSAPPDPLNEPGRSLGIAECLN